MPEYKLIYFDMRGRAEVTRLLFAYEGQKYEDIRLRRRDWPTYKSSIPFGQVPVLEIDGKAYSETVAINNYLAAQFGLYGKTVLDRLQIDEVIGKTREAQAPLFDFFHALMNKDKKADEEENLDVEFVRNLGIFQKILEKNGTGFYVGNEITYADIAVFDVVDTYFPNSLLEKYPKVKTNHLMVRNHPRLRNYIATRKASRL